MSGYYCLEGGKKLRGGGRKDDLEEEHKVVNQKGGEGNARGGGRDGVCEKTNRPFSFREGREEGDVDQAQRALREKKEN